MVEVHVKGSPSIEVNFESKVTQLTGGVIVDPELSLDSENPVMNKVITGELNKLTETVGEGIPIQSSTGNNSGLQKIEAETFTNKNTYSSTYGQEINAEASGDYSLALGGDNAATAKRAVAQGHRCIAHGENSHAEGHCAVVEYVDEVNNGYGSHAEGYSTIVTGTYSHAEGNKTIVNASNGHAEGSETIVSGGASHAEGYGTQANAIASHAEGNNTKTNKDYSHAEGRQTEAIGEASHTEGNETITEGDYAHAEGWMTRAKGAYSHAEGQYTFTYADAAHSEGNNTHAHAPFSHAEGLGTKTNPDIIGQHVEGYYNAASDGVKIIGCGTSDEDRKNAVEVKQDGRVFVKGLGNFDGTNSNDAADLKHVIDNKANKNEVYNKTEMDNRIEIDLVQKVEVATINGQSILKGGNIEISSENITYDELVSLRDNSQLKAGMFYRITDYEATSSDVNTLCPNSLPFDVVVQAVSNRCLSVDAIGLAKGDITEILRLDYYLSPKEGPFFNWWLPEGKLSYRITEVNADVIAVFSIGQICLFNDFSGDLQINGGKVIGENAVYYVTEDGTFYTKTDSAYFGKGIPVSSKGLVARVRDAYGNDFPYDFRNITVNNMTDTDDLTLLPPGNAGIYPQSINSSNVRNVVVEPCFSVNTFEIPKVRILPFAVKNVHVGKNCSQILIYMTNINSFPLLSIGEGCDNIKVTGCSVGSYCGRLRLLGSFTMCKVGNFVNGLRIQGHFLNLKLNDGCGRYISGPFCEISCEMTTSDGFRVANVTLDGLFETNSYEIKKVPTNTPLQPPKTTIAADSNGVIKEFNLADLAN